MLLLILILSKQEVYPEIKKYTIPTGQKHKKALSNPTKTLLNRT
jgi:hypothetical protein